MKIKLGMLSWSIQVEAHYSIPNLQGNQQVYTTYEGD